jgi:hypothetical protein
MNEQGIQLSGGDQSKPAKWFSVSRLTLREKLVRHGLHTGGSRAQPGAWVEPAP